MKKKNILKSVSFNPKDEKDMELYKELQKLPHGEFSRQTKKYWWNRLFRNKKEEN